MELISAKPRDEYGNRKVVTLVMIKILNPLLALPWDLQLSIKFPINLEDHSHSAFCALENCGKKDFLLHVMIGG